MWTPTSYRPLSSFWKESVSSKSLASAGSIVNVGILERGAFSFGNFKGQFFHFFQTCCGKEAKKPFSTRMDSHLMSLVPALPSTSVMWPIDFILFGRHSTSSTHHFILVFGFHGTRFRHIETSSMPVLSGMDKQVSLMRSTTPMKCLVMPFDDLPWWCLPAVKSCFVKTHQVSTVSPSKAWLYFALYKKSFFLRSSLHRCCVPTSMTPVSLFPTIIVLFFLWILFISFYADGMMCPLLIFLSFWRFQSFNYIQNTTNWGKTEILDFVSTLPNIK